MVSLVNLLFEAVWLIILVHVVLSWVPVLDRRHPVVRCIDSIAEPILSPFRQILLPFTRRIGIDLSPILALFVLSIIQRLVIQLLIA